jgi:hypothetical protein
MTYTTNATFEAPPEIVFDVLTDPVGMSRWLPGDLVRNPIGAGLMRVAQGQTGGPVDDADQALLAQQQVAITYLPIPAAGWVADVMVVPLPAGGSSVDITVEPQDCPGEPIPPLVQRPAPAAAVSPTGTLGPARPRRYRAPAARPRRRW